MRRLVAIGLLLGLLAGCSASTSRTGVAELATASPVGTPTPLPTPTMAPTNVPGTSADRSSATAVVNQFAQAVVRDDEIVALLVLSPSAQKVVAASDLHLFLGRAEQPRQVRVGAVQLDADVATVDCVVQYDTDELPIQLRLVRLDGQWRVDGRVAQ